MKSRLDLYNRALELVGARATGQPASAEDNDIADRALIPLLAELNAIEAAYIYVSNDPAAQDITEEVFLPLSDLLANEISPAFGLQRVDAGVRAEMIKRLRRVVASKPTYRPLRVQYF
jgi:hypothetical protein